VVVFDFLTEYHVRTDPRFSTVDIVMTIAIVAYLLGYAPWQGRRRYERLVAERPRDPTAYPRFWRRFFLIWWGLTAVVLTVVLAVPDGLSPADVGLAWPARTGSTVFAAALGLGVIAAQASGVRRVSRMYSGRPWPRRLINAALPRTARERRRMPLVAVTAGVGEELVFRGLFVAAGLGLLGLSPAVAVLVAAAAFGWAHLYQGRRGVALTALSAVVLGLLYVLSGSLLIPVLVHASTDAVAFLLLRPDGRAGSDPSPAPAQAREVQAD
jgi:uncharacterized protein